MKQKYCRLSWCLLILLVLTISIGFRPAIGRSGEKPAGETAGKQKIPSTGMEVMSKMFKGTVVQVISAGRHIYIRIDTGKDQVWVAVPAFNGKLGDKVIVPPGIPFADFHSRNLNRDFKMIYFVGGVRRIDNRKSK